MLACRLKLKSHSLVGPAVMTAILYSYFQARFQQMIFSRFALDEDKLIDLLAFEKDRLGSMHKEYQGEIALFNLQSKLIDALKKLLALLAMPNLHAFFNQLSYIFALYREIDSEKASAQRRKDQIHANFLAQAKSMQESIILADLAYYKDKNSHHIPYSRPAPTPTHQVKGLLAGLFIGLGVFVDNYAKALSPLKQYPRPKPKPLMDVDLVTFIKNLQAVAGTSPANQHLHRKLHHKLR
jgi:hypothetical protein